MNAVAVANGAVRTDTRVLLELLIKAPQLGFYDADAEQRRLMEIIVARYDAMLRAVNSLFERALTLEPGTLRLDDAAVRRLILTKAADRVVRIDNTTRTALRAAIAEGQMRGLSSYEIANGRPARVNARGITEPAFPGIDGLFQETWKSRAQTVARTELQNAQIESSMDRFRASGVVSAVIARDGGTVDSDSLCNARNGRLYPSNLPPPIPAHPNCTLVLIPVVDPHAAQRLTPPPQTIKARNTGTEPRVPAGSPHGGEWTSGGGGIGKLTVTHESPFNGRPVPTTKISKQELGRIGEQVAIAYLRQHEHQPTATAANKQKTNYPVDATYDHRVVEIKAGNISNKKSSQQWRLTIGEPGKSEKALIAKMSPEQKRMHNARKEDQIRIRKAHAMREIEARVGHPVTARTITSVIDHDARVAHMYSFDGFHPRIGWTSEEAQRAYIGTVRY